MNLSAEELKIVLTLRGAMEAVRDLELVKKTVDKLAKSNYQSLIKEQAQLGKQAQELSNTFAMMGQGFVKNNTGLMAVSNVFRALGADLVDSGTKLVNWGKSTQWVGKQLTANLTLPIVAFGTVVSKMAIDFDKEMRNVAAIVGTTASLTNPLYVQMSDSAREIGRTTTIGTKEASGALYELVSAGMSAEESMANLRTVVQFAEAGNMDLADATNFATRAAMAWADKGYTMQQIIDLTSIAVNKSTAHFSDFTHNIEMSQQFAQQAGLSYEDLAQAMMVLSDKGAPLARIGFNISQMFAQMINPSDKARAVMDELGLAYYNANGKMKAMPQILKEIKEKTKDLTDEKKAEALNTLFNIRAGRAALSLISASGEEYDSYAEKLKNANGTTAQMAKTIEESNSGSWQIMINRFKDAAITLGNKFLPTIIQVGNAVAAIMEKFNNMNPKIQDMIIKFMVALAVIGPFLIALGTLAQLAGLARIGLGKIFDGIGLVVRGLTFLPKAITAVNTALAFLAANPIVLIIAAIIAVVAGLAYVIYRNWGPISQFLINSWNTMKLGAETIWTAVATFFTNIWTAISTAAVVTWTAIKDTIVNVWNTIWYWIGPVVNVIYQIIRLAFWSILAIIKSVCGFIYAIISGLWNGLVANLTPPLTALWDFISWIFNGIYQTISGIITAVRVVITTVWPVISGAVSAGLSALAEFFRRHFGEAYDTVAGAVNGIKDMLVNLAKGAWEWGSNLISNFANGIRSKIGDIGDAIKGAADKVKGFVTGNGNWRGGIIEAQRYAKGGVVRAAQGMVAGSSTLRDRVPALLTPGEVVLNKTQQKRLLTGDIGGGGDTIYEINFNVGNMIASPGEQREFARGIKRLLEQDERRYA
jgi:TP901 family phage tail tape measure protein